MSNSSPIPPKISPKRKQFCLEYIKDHNATQAATRTGYKKKSAYSTGQRMLKYDEVKEFLKYLEEPIEKEIKISAEMVLRHIADIAVNGQKESNRVRALQLLGEHLKLFTQLHESTMTFNKMGEIEMKKKDGSVTKLKFDIGKDPKGAKK